MITQFDVTIAGEINLDLILYGLPENLAVDREILATDFQLTLGSSSAILAHNLAALGVRVGFITRLGSDELGTIALDRLSESHVDLSRVIRTDGPTKTGVTILLDHRGSRRILTYPGAMFEMSRADLDLDYLASARHFHLSSLFLHKALQPDLPSIFGELKRRGMTISLDTNDDPDDRWDGVLEELLQYVDVLLPNTDEVRRIARRETVEEALDVLSLSVPLIVVKSGSRGAIVQHGKERFQVAPIVVDTVDTIGAGDSFNAGFLAAWLSGADLRACAAAGNITGGLSTQKPGGTEAFRNSEFRDGFLSRHGFPRLKVSSPG
ncbi:MAG TPA: sugar kinase [Silvibacterium sp.]|nr:sugar kinase [Silvibacterium sp.]